jgi:putative membrane protein
MRGYFFLTQLSYYDERMFIMSRCLTLTVSVLALMVLSPLAFADVNEMVKEWQGPKDSKEFATQAAEGGMFEVKAAQLAQQKATSQEVKDLAKKIEQDHTTANNELMALAKQKNITLPTNLQGACEEKYQTLEKLDGKTFDDAYVYCMIGDHLKDIMAFNKEANHGTDADVKQWASKCLPTLREHLTRTGTVAQSLGYAIDALASGHGEGARPAGSRIKGTDTNNSTRTPGSSGSKNTGSNDTQK